jgi:hypothetical protein
MKERILHTVKIIKEVEAEYEVIARTPEEAEDIVLADFEDLEPIFRSEDVLSIEAYPTDEASDEDAEC